MREAETLGQWWEQAEDEHLPFHINPPNAALPSVWRPTDGGGQVVIEGVQGYDLGLHGQYYPQSTSSDCTAIDFLSMAGISPWDRRVQGLRVWVTARVYPIRVAGNSGPLHGETTWARLGLPQERTTVTNKIRRVGTWNEQQVKQAVAANGGHPVAAIALTMLDQMFPRIAGITSQEELEQHFDAMQFIEYVEQECDALVGLVGTGPDTMVEIKER
jgi:adenylosuccinate synthase